MSRLSEKYTQNKLHELATKVRRLDETRNKNAVHPEMFMSKLQLAESKLMTEDRMLTILAETLDKNDVEQIQKALEQFDSIVPDGSPLDAALDGIKAELLKSMKGGLLNTIKDMLTPKNAKPLARSLAFLTSLRQGLGQLGTILKTAVPKGTDLSKTGEQTLNQLINDQAKAVMVQDAFLKAIKPQGLFQAFSAIPYLDDKNARNIAIDLMNMTGPAVLKLMQGAQGIQMPATSKSDVQAAVQTASGKENAAPQGGTSSAPTDAATPGVQAAAGTQATTATPASGESDRVKSTVLQAAKADAKLAKLGADNINKIVDLALNALQQK